MKRIFSKLLILLAASFLLPLCEGGGCVLAQSSGMLSPYSRFGLGLVHDQSQGFNKAMGGVGLGVRMGNRVNTSNPASYAFIDSMSIIFDVGMTASFGGMRQDGKSVAVKGASFDYAHVGMHIAKNLGLAAGFMPYTRIGYSYSSPESQKSVIGYNPNTGVANILSETYSGEGGLNQAYLGLGWRVFRGLSVGANASFVWGSYTQTFAGSISESGSTIGAFAVVKNASLRTYKIDLGVQYPVRLTRQDWLSLGLTTGLGHKIKQDVDILVGEDLDSIPSPFDLPYSFGFGAAWQHKNTLLVAADLHHELWSNCRQPMASTTADGYVPDGYVPMKGGYGNRTKIAVGAQWTPNPFDTNYWKRVQYRAGANFTTPYLKMNGTNGPYEFSMSVGAGIPITNRINNRSYVNAGLQWLRRSSSHEGMITENYLLVNIGITFNERWFMKYKIE